MTSLRLHNLSPKQGAKHRRKLLGRGESSGRGKTSGRGGKGQTARSGSSVRIGFEGGQMPLIRRIPKRGFNNKRFKTVYIPVNLEALNRFDDGARIDESILRETGLANGRADGIKILGDGDLRKKLNVIAHAFSASARQKIEQAGGSCEIVVVITRDAANGKPRGEGQWKKRVAAAKAEAKAQASPS